MKVSTLVVAPLFLALVHANLADPDLVGQGNPGLKRRQRIDPPPPDLDGPGGPPPPGFDGPEGPSPRRGPPTPGPRGGPPPPGPREGPPPPGPRNRFDDPPSSGPREGPPPPGPRGGPLPPGPRGGRVLNTNDNPVAGPDRDGEIMRVPPPEFDRGRPVPPPGIRPPPPAELEFLPPLPEDFGGPPRGGPRDRDKRLPLPPMPRPPIKGVPPPQGLRERQLPPNRRPLEPLMPLIPPTRIGGRPPPPPMHAALGPPPPGPMPKLSPLPGRGLNARDHPTTLVRQVRSTPSVLPDMELLRRSMEVEVYGEIL